MDIESKKAITSKVEETNQRTLQYMYHVDKKQFDDFKPKVLNLKAIKSIFKTFDQLIDLGLSEGMFIHFDKGNNRVEFRESSKFQNVVETFTEIFINYHVASVLAQSEVDKFCPRKFDWTDSKAVADLVRLNKFPSLGNLYWHTIATVDHRKKNEVSMKSIINESIGVLDAYLKSAKAKPEKRTQVTTSSVVTIEKCENFKRVLNGLKTGPFDVQYVKKLKDCLTIGVFSGKKLSQSGFSYDAMESNPILRKHFNYLNCPTVLFNYLNPVISHYQIFNHVLGLLGVQTNNIFFVCAFDEMLKGERSVILPELIDTTFFWLKDVFLNILGKKIIILLHKHLQTLHGQAWLQSTICPELTCHQIGKLGYLFADDPVQNRQQLLSDCYSLLNFVDTFKNLFEKVATDAKPLKLTVSQKLSGVFSSPEQFWADNKENFAILQIIKSTLANIERLTDPCTLLFEIENSTFCGKNVDEFSLLFDAVKDTFHFKELINHIKRHNGNTNSNIEPTIVDGLPEFTPTNASPLFLKLPTTLFEWETSSAISLETIQHTKKHKGNDFENLLVGVKPLPFQTFI